MKKSSYAAGVALASIVVAANSLPGLADAISPSIRDTGKRYSTEPARSDYYGTGIAGRAMEAMELRFQVDRALQDGEWDIAISKAKKACQLDPSDPGTHVLLARGLTKKLYANKGPIDEKLLRQCLYEWTMIWHHDADQWEQLEAKNETRRLTRVARVLAQQHEAEELARMAAKEELARKRAEARQLAAKQTGVSETTTSHPEATGSAADATTGTVPSAAISSTANTANNSTNNAIGTATTTTATISELEAKADGKKKKRFMLF